MTIVSLPFFAFVKALVAVYFLVPKSWRWVVLLAGSCVFYWLNSKWLLLVLLAGAVAAVYSYPAAYLDLVAVPKDQKAEKNR